MWLPAWLVGFEIPQKISLHKITGLYITRYLSHSYLKSLHSNNGAITEGWKLKTTKAE
jgi:hypothetical protein